LGNLYAGLGQTALAISYFEQALIIAREIEQFRLEGHVLFLLAYVLIDEKRNAEAIRNALDSSRIGKAINSPFIINGSNSLLALAHLYGGDLLSARKAAEIARNYDEPVNNHYVFAVLGLIALRQGDVAAALEAFMEAVAQAETMLTHSAQNCDALDSKGLALCGLVVCGDAGRVAEAAEAYRAARAINRDAGIVGRVLRLFDTLAESDGAGLLAGVRAAATGE
jgi:tetratricopeptide (TPR) repeat protein